MLWIAAEINGLNMIASRTLPSLRRCVSSIHVQSSLVRLAESGQACFANRALSIKVIMELKKFTLFNAVLCKLSLEERIRKKYYLCDETEY